MTKYTKDHEWLRVEGDLVIVGITDMRATQLGDVVFVELPEGRHEGGRGRSGRRDRKRQGGLRHLRADFDGEISRSTTSWSTIRRW